MTFVVAVFVSLFVACTQYQQIQAQEEKLSHIIKEAETHSQLIAEDINRWISTEGSELQGLERTTSDIFQSRPRRSPRNHKYSKKVFKGKAKFIKLKHSKTKKLHHEKKTLSKKLHSGSKLRQNSELSHTEKSEPANNHVRKKDKVHSVRMREKAKMASKTTSKKVTKVKRVLKSLKPRAKQKKIEIKKLTIPKNIKLKQKNNLLRKKQNQSFDPQVLKVFRKLPRKTLKKYLQTKGLSKNVIKNIIKQVEKPSGNTQKSSSETKKAAKRDDIPKPFLSVETKKQNIHEKKARRDEKQVKKSSGTTHKNQSDTTEETKTDNSKHSLSAKTKIQNIHVKKTKLENKTNQVSKKHSGNVSIKGKAAKKLLTREGKRKEKQKVSSSDSASKISLKVIHSLKTSSKGGNRSTHARNLGNTPKKKLEKLKHNIRKANDLKLRVAKALLTHCETQNRLKKVFENVNKSLRKASKLATAIGEKFGISKKDINKMTSDHTRDVVEDFLGKIF